MDELSGQGDLQAFFEARRRIVAAFEDIAAGTESLALESARLGDGAADPAEFHRLRAEVEEERVVNAQLTERVRALRERQGDRLVELEDDLTRARERIRGLEAERAAQRAEIDAVLAELIPIIEEAR